MNKCFQPVSGSNFVRFLQVEEKFFDISVKKWSGVVDMEKTL